jgi:hypothetical protein
MWLLCCFVTDMTRVRNCWWMNMDIGWVMIFRSRNESTQYHLVSVRRIDINVTYCSLRQWPRFSFSLGPFHAQHEPSSSSSENDASASWGKRNIKLPSQCCRVNSGLSAGCYGYHRIGADISKRCTDNKISIVHFFSLWKTLLEHCYCLLFAGKVKKR